MSLSWAQLKPMLQPFSNGRVVHVCHKSELKESFLELKLLPSVHCRTWFVKLHCRSFGNLNCCDKLHWIVCFFFYDFVLLYG